RTDRARAALRPWYRIAAQLTAGSLGRPARSSAGSVVHCRPGAAAADFTAAGDAGWLPTRALAYCRARQRHAPARTRRQIEIGKFVQNVQAVQPLELFQTFQWFETFQSLELVQPLSRVLVCRRPEYENLR